MTATATAAAGRSTEQTAIDTLRTLSMDAVQAAGSGHPGTPMALAPVAYTLWTRFLRYDPERPTWADRDRFVLSVGHASALLYSLLHLTGVTAVGRDGDPLDRPAVRLADLQDFRQLDSSCPGHPEHGWTTGVECTTGPLGTGAAATVGMASAARWRAATFNRPGHRLFDHDVYALCGDGDLMEGVAAEAASLAGHLGLDNLCWIYDRNRITIEGSTDLAFTEDVAARFRAYGWAVAEVADANDIEAMDAALRDFGRERGRPTLIIVDSVIGWGAPTKQGSPTAHGEPLGTAEVRGAKQAYGWPTDRPFHVPDGVYDHFDRTVTARGGELRRAWEEAFARYAEDYPDLADQLERMERGRLPDHWDRDLPEFPADPGGVATREASGQVLNAVAGTVPWLVGGASDLAPSTRSRLTVAGAGDFGRHDRAGRNLHFGVREHAAAAVANGWALSRVRVFQAGFLIFSDFQRGALRLSSLMELPVIHLFTHDSIGVGEDGPTHQPVEQLAGLRAVPGLLDMRPGDANEVVEAWRTVLPMGQQPVALVLSRQALPTLDRTRFASARGTARGAYVLAGDPADVPDVILIASGSEVALAVEAYERLVDEGVRTRVVSMPSMQLFARQTSAYRDQVLPPEVTARVAIEQASPFGWHRWVGAGGAVVGMETFGASAPLAALRDRFGFTADAVVAAARDQLWPSARSDDAAPLPARRPGPPRSRRPKEE